MSTTKKYRPYFTLADLKHLANLAHKDNQLSPLTKYLQQYVNQIDSGWRAANYETTGRGVVSKLADALASPEETKANVTAYQKEQDRRYNANEMSPEEEQEYLKSIGAVF